MADFGAPSFSLGLDFDFNLKTAPRDAFPCRTTEESCSKSCKTFDEDDDLRLKTLDLDFNCRDEDPDPPPVLKRLRRGPSTPLSRIDELKSVQFSNNDDEIEDFSSQEDRCNDKHISTQNCSACTSSKMSLHGNGVLTTQFANKLKAKPPAFNTCMFSNFETGSDKKLLPKLTISPPRKIQFLDSDSDELSPSEDRHKDFYGHRERGAAISSKTLNCGSLSKDFGKKKTYFGSVKSSNTVCSNKGEPDASRAKSLVSDDLSNKGMHCFQKNTAFESVGNPFPPAYRYFYNDDPRIRNLVRGRLFNFFPLGTVNHAESQQPETVSIDYMSQFGQQDDPSKAYGTTDVGRSKKSSKRPNNVKATVISKASKGWVNPRSSVTIPRDAGKRRVCADSRSAGHWYTGQDGRKVYITKNGQELTGQTAYMNYRKDKGGRFKKTKTKKKAAVARKKSK